MDAELIRALKALSDATRLRLLGCLARGRRHTVDQLASALDLSTVAVSHHLQRLVDAGLVEAVQRASATEYALRKERLASIGAALDRIEREDREEPSDLPASSNGAARSPEEEKVLRAFIVDGRLDHIPAHEKKRLVILRFLAETDLAEGREYPEKELNAILARRHPDVASLRRYLVDHRFVARDAGLYRLVPAEDWPGQVAAGP